MTPPSVETGPGTSGTTQVTLVSLPVSFASSFLRASTLTRSFRFLPVFRAIYLVRRLYRLLDLRLLRPKQRSRVRGCLLGGSSRSSLALPPSLLLPFTDSLILLLPSFSPGQVRQVLPAQIVSLVPFPLSSLFSAHPISFQHTSTRPHDALFYLSTLPSPPVCLWSSHPLPVLHRSLPSPSTTHSSTQTTSCSLWNWFSSEFWLAYLSWLDVFGYFTELLEKDGGRDALDAFSFRSGFGCIRVREGRA